MPFPVSSPPDRIFVGGATASIRVCLLTSIVVTSLIATPRLPVGNSFGGSVRSGLPLPNFIKTERVVLTVPCDRRIRLSRAANHHLT
jgi:hypothetical protein